MKNKSIIYIILTIFFFVLGYLFVDSGIHAKTKLYVTYQDSSDVSSKIYYDDNKVSYIDINYLFNSIYSKEFSGYYKYSIKGYLVAYKDNKINEVYKKEYNLLDDQVKVIDQNDVKEININDNIIIDYDKYMDDLLDFINYYGMDVSGYLLVSLEVEPILDFYNFNKTIEDVKIVNISIPLTNESFKIDVDNINVSDSYYDFSSKDRLNYMLLVFGAFNISLGMAFLALVIKNIRDIFNKENNYKNMLKIILKNNNDKIININDFNNIKNYNILYLNSFDELLEIYNQVGSLISFKEIKKNNKAIFMITNKDTIWIYKLSTD